MSKAKISKAVMDRTCILILGMHRSGTSALAGVLSKLGCELPASPMAASKSNAKGFFESVAVRDFNEDLLASAGSSWDDFTSFHDDWLETHEAPFFLERAVNLLEQEYGDAPLFVLKDPRICRLVPFWITALERFGRTAKPVLTIRNPLEVSHSLLTKKDYSEPLSQMVWLRHVLDAERATRGMIRFQTSFEQLMKSWETVAQRAQENLLLTWPKPIAKVEFDVARFLSGDLRHHKESETRVLANSLLPGWLRDTYEILNGWAETGEAAADHARLDQIKAEFDVASNAFARLVRYERDSSAAHKQEVQRVQEASRLRQEELSAIIDESMAHRSMLEERSVASDRERKELEFRLSVLSAETEQQRTALAKSMDQQKASECERDALRAQLAGLSAQAEQQRAAQDKLIDERRAASLALQDQLSSIAASASLEIESLNKSLQEQRRNSTLLRADLHQQTEARADAEAQLSEARSEIAANRARRKEMARVISNRDAKIAVLNAELQARFAELAILERHMLRTSIMWWIRQLSRRMGRLKRRLSGAKPISRANLPV